MGDNDDNGLGNLGELLFGYLVYREIRDGRLDSGQVLRALAAIVLVVGCGLLLLLAVAMPSTRTYDGGALATDEPAWTDLPAFVPTVTDRPTVDPIPEQSASPEPTPRPRPLPGVGTRVDAVDGWAVTVTSVSRWRPRGYREPGWRLITVHVKLRMPASDACVFTSMFWLEARGGREYQSDDRTAVRQPELFECADYHRPTTVGGWVTFEVRDKDAKRLVLNACPGVMFGCEWPTRIQLP